MRRCYNVKNVYSKSFNVSQGWMIKNVVICIQHAGVLQLIARDVDDTCQVLGLLHNGSPFPMWVGSV